ncbi:MAG: substrate-binding domain-containing protein [Chloroflexi bacterium]|nr:substrate-binding domain-containing protein [Chloroflexota bacterium]
MPTISDVAKRAGVSPATVSRVIQGAKNVRPATRERVERAIQELGYVPSAVAQSLRSKRTRSLALVVSDITNTFWTTVARGVEDVAHRHDYSVFLCNTDENLAKQLRYLDFLISQQVDGVIIAPYDSEARHLDKLRQRNIPTVLIDRRIEGWDVDSVGGDSVSGARALVQHVISLGHRRIAMVSGAASTSTAEDRVAGYCIALAEAGIALDARLIKRGEFRLASGEELTDQLLQDGLGPTAIFAANNAIAMGVIAALEKRGLRIPQDIALVCYDDFPTASRFFPFLTVVAQPAYDMGVNAAQLLLSRLDSEVSLQPRHVVLPSRLIVRHSCGSTLRDGEERIFSLPLPRGDAVRSSMVKPLSPEERHDLSACTGERVTLASRRPGRLSDCNKSDVHRLLQVLQHQEADRLPHLELQVTSQAVYEYVLEHELAYDVVGAKVGGDSIAPEDRVEFALRLGMDAVPCDFSWRPQGTAPDDLPRPPSLADQLSTLERYLRAAQGTSVGIIASFSSFLDTALAAAVVEASLPGFRDQQPVLEQLMDIIVENQEKVMRVVCDRFADDLALVMVNDDVARCAGLRIPADLFMEVFPRRMQRLIAPAKEHGKLVAMHSDGKLDGVLSILHDIGFDAVHPLVPECNDIFDIKRRWNGRMALMGNIPTTLLAYGRREEIEERVREYCVELAPGGGYVLSSSNGIIEGIPPENFVAMTQAVHRHGRYGSLGKDV